MMNSPIILLVDDCPVFVEYQSTLLTEVGFTVIATLDASEVSSLIRRYNPDLLILDKVMPIDGLTIAKQVRQEFDYLPVLILTSTPLDVDKKKALALGCIDYIKKNIDSENFIKYIRQFCLVGTLTKTMTTLSDKFDKNLAKLEQELIHYDRKSA